MTPTAATTSQRRRLKPRSRLASRLYRSSSKTSRALLHPTGRFQWRPLPQGQASPQRVRGHYRERLDHEGRLDKFDEDRLATATSLPYEEWWVPTERFGGFDAYSIISFAHTDKVLLECPIYGNAAYVIDAPTEVWQDQARAHRGGPCGEDSPPGGELAREGQTGARHPILEAAAISRSKARQAPGQPCPTRLQRGA